MQQPSGANPLDEQAFATAVLKGIGAPVNQSTLDFFYAWMSAEGGHTNGALYNPLNTTEPGFGGTNAVGSVKAYPDMQSGINATIATLKNGNYKNVLDSLQAGDGANARTAVINSPWAASHYGGGSAFPSVGSSQGVVLTSSGASSSGASAAGTTQAPTVLTMDDLLKDEGWTAAFLQTSPELMSIFQQALGKKGPLNKDGTIWTMPKFEAEIQNSTWWKTHSDTARQYIAMETTDPAKFNQAIQQQFQKIHDISIQMGALTPYAIGMQMAKQSLMAGWGDSQLKSALQTYVKLNAQGSYQGDAATAAQTLKKYAYDNGVNVSDSWLQGAVSQIEGGNMSLQQAQQTLQGYASSAFPGYKEQLQTGMTMQQIADPFIQSYAKIMGVDPATVDLFNPKIRQAMAGTIDPKTGQAQPQSIWQFEQSVRQDPAWMTTKDANDTLSTLGHKVLQDMGVTW